MLKTFARRGGIILAVLVSMRILAACVWPTINDVTTGATPEYPDLKPQHFAQGYDQVYDAALAVGRGLGWDVTADDRAKGEIQAVATTRIFRFKDDVTVTLARETAGVTVGVRSHSRIGKGDLGTNARRIRLFQTTLAERLASPGASGG